MKILLAPLFFHCRFCKKCARIIYRDQPGRWLGLYEFQSMPPLGSFDTSRGFIPDYPVLLMFDEFVLDGEAYERLKHPVGKPWLRGWSELVDALESEGSLTIKDVATAASTNSYRRGWMLRRDLIEPQRWGRAMGYYDALTSKAQKLLGKYPQEAQDLAWEFDPRARFGVRGTDGETHDLSVVLLEAGRSENKAHRDLYSTALYYLKSQLREVNACLNGCQELGVAPLMWAPYRRYLEEKLGPIDRQALDQEAAGHTFFEISFPACAPTTTKEFVSLRADRRINSLRGEILRASKSGETLDPQYPQRILVEVLGLERRGARLRRISGWIASAVGTIPIPGLGLAAKVVTEVVTTQIERKRREPFRWFYLISDGRGAT